MGALLPLILAAGALLLFSMSSKGPTPITGMSAADIKTAVQEALDVETDPAKLTEFANALAALNYTDFAKALLAKAAHLGGSPVPGPSPQPQPAPASPSVADVLLMADAPPKIQEASQDYAEAAGSMPNGNTVWIFAKHPNGEIYVIEGAVTETGPDNGGWATVHTALGDVAVDSHSAYVDAAGGGLAWLQSNGFA